MVTDFETALAVLTGGGVELAELDKLIVLKRAAGRPKDLLAVAELQGILERRKAPAGN